MRIGGLQDGCVYFCNPRLTQDAIYSTQVCLEICQSIKKWHIAKLKSTDAQ